MYIYIYMDTHTDLFEVSQSGIKSGFKLWARTSHVATKLLDPKPLNLPSTPSP